MIAILPAAWLFHLPILQVVFPLLAAPICVLLRRRSWAYGFTILVTGIGVVFSLVLLKRTFNGSATSYALGGFPPPWGIEYRIDAANAIILLLVSASGFLALLQSHSSINDEIPAQRQNLFYAAFLLCLTGLLGVAATADAFNAFVFLEISSLATYSLVAMGRVPRALLAAYRYLVLGTIGASLFVVGVGMLYMATGTLNMADLAARLPPAEHRVIIEAGFALIFIGLGLKAAIFPLHFWLPNAYAFAPSLVTIFLAATATKVALYLLARFMYMIFPEAIGPDASIVGALMLLLAVLAIFLASAAAFWQVDVKRMLAYSSVAQVGYMLLALSLGTTAGIAAAWLLLLTHALAKGGLFMAVACVTLNTRSSNLNDWRGLAKQMPFSAIAITVCLFSLIGVPLTAGFIAKWNLLVAVFNMPVDWSWLLAALVAVSSLLTLLYAGRILEILFLGRSTENSSMSEAPFTMLAVALVVAVMNIYFGVDSVVLRDIASSAAWAIMHGL